MLCATNPEPKTVGRRWNISNGGIAIWKGPIANLSSLHFMTTNVQRIHIFHNASFDGCSSQVSEKCAFVWKQASPNSHGWKQSWTPRSSASTCFEGASALAHDMNCPTAQVFLDTITGVWWPWRNQWIVLYSTNKYYMDSYWFIIILNQRLLESAQFNFCWATCRDLASSNSGHPWFVWMRPHPKKPLWWKTLSCVVSLANYIPTEIQ